MKFCKIQDTLNRCSSFLDVACIALDNEHFFPEGNTISLLLDAYSARTAHPFQRNGAPFRFKLSKAQQVY